MRWRNLASSSWTVFGAHQKLLAAFFTLLLTTSCTKGIPELSSLSSALLSGPTFQGVATKNIDVMDMNAPMSFSGECDKRYQSLEWRLNNGEWADPNQAIGSFVDSGADFDCSDGVFSFTLTSASSAGMSFSNVGDTQTTEMRGQTLIGPTGVSQIIMTMAGLPVSEVNSSIAFSGANTQVVSNLSSTSLAVEVTLRDTANAPVAGIIPELSITGSNNNYSCVASDVNGVSTCQVWSTKAESKTIEMTSPVSKALATNAIYTHGAVAQLVFKDTPSLQQKSGVVFAAAPSVEGFDSFGNLATTASNSVTLKLVDQSSNVVAFSTGVTSSVVMTSGLASFSGIKTDNSGLLDLVAESGVLSARVEDIKVDMSSIALVGSVYEAINVCDSFFVNFKDVSNTSGAILNDKVLNLSSGSGTTVFAATAADCAGGNYITSLNVSAGTSSVEIFAKDSNAGSYVITVSEASASLTSDTVAGAARPIVTSIYATSGLYGIGDNLNIYVQFSHAVDVLSGSPLLTLATGGAGFDAVYSSGSGTNTLVFNYTVAAGHASADLDYTATSAFRANGSSIRLAATSLLALTTLPAPSTTGSLSQTSNVVIDGVAPSMPTLARHTPAGSLAAIVNPVFRVGTTAGEGAVTVQLYDGTAPDCAVAVGPSQTLTGNPYDLTSAALSEGTYLFGVKVFDAAGNASPCSSILSYELDLTPPAAPTIVRSSGTPAISNDSEPEFEINFNNSDDVQTVKLYMGAGCTNYNSDLSQSSAPFLTSNFTPLITDGVYTYSVKVVDAAGNVSSCSNDATYEYDTIPPYILSMIAPTYRATGYIAGETLNYNAVFSENVIASGSSFIPIKIGRRVLRAKNSTASGSAILYEYRIDDTDVDMNGLSSGATEIELDATASITDAAGNAADLALPVVNFSDVFIPSKYCAMYLNTTAVEGISGDGTTATPFHICNYQQLRTLAINCSFRCAQNFKLMNDIHYPDGEFLQIAHDTNGLTPTFDGTSFSGGIDGNGFTVSGISISAAGGYNIGFLGHISGIAVIKNMHLEDVSVTGAGNVGALVGATFSSTAAPKLTIDGISATGSVTGVDTSVGGLVGRANGAIDILRSKSSISVTGTSNVGGLVGSAYASASPVIVIQSSQVTADVTASGNYAGGIVGYAEKSTHILESFHRQGTVLANNYAGGVLGYAMDTNSGSNMNLYNVYSISAVRALVSSAGGIVGSIVSTAQPAFVNFSRVFSASEIVATDSATGGVSGHLYNYNMYQAFYDTTLYSGNASSNVASPVESFPRTSSQLMQSTTYLTGWFGAGAWRIRENLEYPTLFRNQRHQVMFVTGAPYNGATAGTGDVSGLDPLVKADNHCRSVALDAGHLNPFRYKAVLGDLYNPAKNRIQIRGPVYNTAGHLLAEDEADFWDGLNMAVLYTASGGTSSGSVWTGIFADGEIGSTCSSGGVSWSDGSATGTLGLSGSAGTAAFYSSVASCTSTARLYCISDQ